MYPHPLTGMPFQRPPLWLVSPDGILDLTSVTSANRDGESSYWTLATAAGGLRLELPLQTTGGQLLQALDRAASRRGDITVEDFAKFVDSIVNPPPTPEELRRRAAEDLLSGATDPTKLDGGQLGDALQATRVGETVDFPRQLDMLERLMGSGVDDGVVAYHVERIAEPLSQSATTEEELAELRARVFPILDYYGKARGKPFKLTLTFPNR